MIKAPQISYFLLLYHGVKSLSLLKKKRTLYFLMEAGSEEGLRYLMQNCRGKLLKSLQVLFPDNFLYEMVNINWIEREVCTI